MCGDVCVYLCLFICASTQGQYGILKMKLAIYRDTRMEMKETRIVVCKEEGGETDTWREDKDGWCVVSARLEHLTQHHLNQSSITPNTRHSSFSTVPRPVHLIPYSVTPNIQHSKPSQCDPRYINPPTLASTVPSQTSHQT